MDIFETTAKYAYKQSLKILTTKDFIIAIILFVMMLMIGTVINRKTKSWNRRKTISISILFPYIYLVLMFALFGRTEVKHPTYELMPFWSYYEAFAHGKKILLLECLLNILMFVPLGFCLAGVEMRFRYVILAGACMSFFIEVNQLISQKGLFELFDDPFHNIMGSILGYWVFGVMRKGLKNSFCVKL